MGQDSSTIIILKNSSPHKLQVSLRKATQNRTVASEDWRSSNHTVALQQEEVDTAAKNITTHQSFVEGNNTLVTEAKTYLQELIQKKKDAEDARRQIEADANLLHPPMFNKNNVGADNTDDSLKSISIYIKSITSRDNILKFSAPSAL